MAITFLQEKKKNDIMTLILAITLLITFFFIWKYFFAGNKFFVKQDFTVEIVAPQKIEINLEILNSPVLDDLRSFEKSPGFTGKVGRENPFIPY